MTRYELSERGLVAGRGRLHEFRDLDRHRAHHAIERPLGARLIQEASDVDDPCAARGKTSRPMSHFARGGLSGHEQGKSAHLDLPRRLRCRTEPDAGGPPRRGRRGLHEWVIATKAWREASGLEGGEEN